MRIGQGVLHYGAVTGAIRTTVLGLPWRSIIFFNLLLLLSALPAWRLSAAVHEISHLIVAHLLGGDIYGLFLRPLSGGLVHGEAEGYALCTIYNIGNLTDALEHFAGVSAELVTGGLALLLLPRVRDGSPWRIFGILFAGISILTALAYLIGGYFAAIGDFSWWRGAMPSIGPLVCLTALLLFGIAAFLLGKSYLKIQRHWVPNESVTQRVLIAFLTIGLFGLYYVPPLVLVMRESIFAVLAIVLGIGIGGFAALLRSKDLPRAPLRFPFRYAILLVGLTLGVETFLSANDGTILFEKSKYAVSYSDRYEDGALIPLSGRFIRMDLGEDGDLYWVDILEGTLQRYRFDSGETSILSGGLERPLRLKAGRDGVYILERGGDPEAGRILFYDSETGNIRVILEGIEYPEGLDVDQNGDIYFTEKLTHLCVLMNGSREKTVLRDDLPEGFSDVAVDSTGNIYVGTSRFGREAEEGSLFRLSKDGREKELIASGLSTPRELDVDAEGNVYIAGAGYSSITLVAKEGDSQPISLRGCMRVRSLAVSKEGDIYYAPLETSRSEIRVLRRRNGV